MYKNGFEDLRQAKLIFFRYGGNKYAMHKEGELSKYEKFNVSIETESRWISEIFDSYLERIYQSKSGFDKKMLLSMLINLDTEEDLTIATTIKVLNQEKMDSFSVILICEILKNKIKSLKKSNNISLVKEELKRQSLILLNTPITIDTKYIESPYMKDYDFSDKNIKLRIKSLNY